jgi:glycosyltransferase involved in cell wall biosynthesis
VRILGLTNLYPNPLQPHRAPFNRDKFQLLAEQHAVRVIAPIAWLDEFRARWKAKGAWHCERRRMDGDVVVEHPRYWYSPRIGRQFYGHSFYASVRRTFRRAVKEFQPDVVLATWAYPDGWAGVRLAREAGLPVVIQVHGSDVLLLDDCPAKRERTAEALSCADRVIAVSEDLARNVVALGARPEKVHVVYNGVDSTLFYPGPRHEARRRLGLAEAGRMVLFIGNLVPVKSIHTLLTASSLLARDGLTHTVAIIGSGPLRDSLAQQARDLGIEHHVRFVGSLDHASLPDWYRAANVFVLPSVSEGVPNVLLEAIASGTPFVASDVGGIPEVAAGGDGTLVPPSNPGELAEAMRSVLFEPRTFEGGPVRNGHHMAAELTEILEGVLGGRPAVELPLALTRPS